MCYVCGRIQLLLLLYPVCAADVDLPPLHVQQHAGGRDAHAERPISGTHVAMDTDHAVRGGAPSEWHEDGGHLQVGGLGCRSVWMFS